VIYGRGKRNDYLPLLVENSNSTSAEGIWSGSASPFSAVHCTLERVMRQELDSEVAFVSCSTTWH
jgi:hypothetical protein